MIEKELTISVSQIPENNNNHGHDYVDNIFTCSQCELDSKKVIEDGFGNSWSVICPECRQDSMQVLAPGEAECWLCA